MQWSGQQEAALKDVERFLKDPDRSTYILLGKAGTGKTTISTAIRENFDGQSCAYAYTGKAASVLRKKGHPDAKTFHSDLYVPAAQSRKRLEAFEARLLLAQDELAKAKREGADTKAQELRAEVEQLKENIRAEHDALHQPQFTLNTQSAIRDLDLLIADEISMVGTRLGSDLEKVCKEAGVKMLLMGDPNQLPPVKDTAHFMTRRPDFVLTEIHRQAQDNPILVLADKAIRGELMKPGSYGDSVVKAKLDPDECLACDQMLVGINETRIYYNSRLRELRGYTDIVEIGEKLMCLRNSKEGFFNGQLWYVDQVHDTTEDGERIHLTLQCEDTQVPPTEALVHTKVLRGEEIHWMDAQGAQNMVSAQAVTVHKFQGSEGNHIVLLDEAYRACRDFPQRWLYTGITRAREKVTIVV